MAIFGGVVVVGMLSSGCGGDGGANADGGGESELSRTEFVRKAKAICRETEIEILIAYQKASDEENGPGHPHTLGIRFIVDVLTPQLQAEIDQIRDLGAPSADQAEVETVLRAMEEVVDKMRASPPDTAHATGNPYEKAQAVARKHGLAGCPNTSASLY